MIKAEVILEHDGVEVPNWVNLCRDVLTSAPTIGTVTVLALAFLGFSVWQHRDAQQPISSTTGVQSIPAATSNLTVVSSTPNSNIPATTNTDLSSLTSNSSNAASIGPAPASSLNSLQPSGTSQQPGGLTQAVNQTVQSAGNAVNTSLGNLGL